MYVSYSSPELSPACLDLPPNYCLRVVVPGRRSTYLLNGLGALAPQNATIANSAASALSVTGTLVAGLTAIPIIGPIAGALAAIGTLLANIFSGCGNTCVEASNIANQVGDALAQNLTTYLSSPVHYASLQAAALNNFDAAWASLVQACSSPSLGSAGQACISDRQRGACKWKASPGGWVQASDGSWSYTPWGAAGSGTACWNYFIGMRDPIANDPTVVPDPTPAAAASSGLLSAVGLSPSTTIAGIPVSDLLLPAGLLVLALVLL